MSRMLVGFVLTWLLIAQLSTAEPSKAAKPSIEDALRLAPLQSDVDYDRPTKEEAARCEVKPESGANQAGWTVENAGGQTLRRFLDTNADKRIDLWCYFKNGIEVYRDIDSDFNGNADQHRWLGTAGIRWGIDPRERGQIRTWKTISAEEVTAEVVAAVRDNDAARFERLLLTNEELQSLGLGEATRKKIADKLAAAPKAFRDATPKQKVIGPKSEWIHFGARKPGVVPAGTEGSKRDLVVYESVAAMIETEGKHDQLLIGTLIQVGDVWRLIDAPPGLKGASSDVAGAFFFETPLPNPAATQVSTGSSGLSEQVQKLITDLEQVDRALGKATGAEKAKLHVRHADLLEQLSQAVRGEERESWLRQLADTVSAAAQTGDYPGGEERLFKLVRSLEQDKAGATIVGYVKFRAMTASYGRSLQASGADFPKIQEKWLADLKKFVADFPHHEDSAEAMLQLAIAEEFAGKDEQAISWYAQIQRDFPDKVRAQKAAGAQRRLESVGKTITLRGKTLDGQSFDLAALRGKPVVIQYWAVWCEPCKQDMDTLKTLQAKYAKAGLQIVGVSLDAQRGDAVDLARSKRLPWPQLYEDGGLDSRLANEMGILTLPTTFLLDAQGKVISRGIPVGDLDAELAKIAK